MIRKRWLLVIISLVIVGAVVVLASSLHDVHFEPGRPLVMRGASSPPLQLPTTQALTRTPLWKILLIWLLFVVNLVLFFYLLPPEMRKRILRQMISFALGVLAIILALRYNLIRLPQFEAPPQGDEATLGTGGAGSNAPEVGFQPPAIAQWWLILISILVLAIFLALLWLAYRWWAGSGARSSYELGEIRDIAQASLDDIAGGREWSDVIIQSYARMSEAVSRRRGLQRHWAATPREFASRLEQAGLPAHAVARLTRLFESARYGARASSQTDINEAVACLNSILQACEPAE
jgi:hypothetical protein